MSAAPELVGIGNALVDVIAFSEEDAVRLLSLKLNEAIHVDATRLAEMLVALPDPVFCAGGGAATTIKIASLLGIRSAFVGRTGSKPHGGPDRFAQLFEEELREAGVEPILMRGKEPTGACLTIRTADGSTAIAAAPSAALGLCAEDLPESLIRSATVLMLDGYALPRTRLIERALNLADRYGTAVALDVGSGAIAAEYAPLIARMAAKFPLILFMNQAEANAFVTAASKVKDLSEDDVYDWLRSMTEAGPFPIIIVKRGARGASVFAMGSRIEAATHPILARDETGAGDSFAAGFLAAWIKNKPLSACAALGNKIAHAVVSIPGTCIDGEQVRRLARTID